MQEATFVEVTANALQLVTTDDEYVEQLVD